MAFARPTLQELIDRVEADLTTRHAAGGRDSAPQHDRGHRAGARRRRAPAVRLLSFLAQATLPDTSETEFLERQASLFGLSRLPAAFAIGNVAATGVNGT
jgi:uncharacterized phage protein gp47/JayE